MSNVVLPLLYYPLLDDNISEIVEPSGRCSAKTTSNEVVAITKMLESKYNNIWYCRAEKGDIRSTIFSSMIATIQLMNAEKYFVWSLSPYRITCIRTGAICYFDGINGKTDDDITATKGFTPWSRTLAMCILDEADQVKHPNHITAWESTAVRFLRDNGKMVFAYNPPMAKNHWAHLFFADKIKNGATKIYATWEDIITLLNPKTIASIEKYRHDEPDYYKYWYLGEPVLFKGMVYPQFDRNKHITNLYEHLAHGDKVMELILGVDEGSIFDSTCVTPLAIMYSGIAIALGCFENDPVKTGAQAPSEQSRDLIKYRDRLLTKFNFLQYVPRRWNFECAEAGQNLMNQLIADTGGTENCMPVRNKNIMGDVKRVRSMLNERVLLFHMDYNDNDPDSCEKLMSDLENYVFDEKTNEIKKGQRDDTIDSLEYGTKLIYDMPIQTI